MQETQIQLIIERLLHSGLVAPNSLVGCSDTELEKLDEIAGTALPEAYISFMRILGNGAGDFLSGTDFLYPAALGLKLATQHLLQSDGATFALPPTAFPFLMHQGSIFCYFDCREGDNPSVWRYLKGENQADKLSETFSEWLFDAVSAEIETRADSFTVPRSDSSDI